LLTDTKSAVPSSLLIFRSFFLEAPKMADKPKRELPSQLKQLLALDVKLSKEVMEAVNRLAKNVISQAVDILLDGRCV
jgi:hypothetical protein